jgi:hypothetical protein
MKFAVFFALVAVSRAAVLAPLTSGSSTVSRSEDGAGNYAFSYDEQHATGGSFRKESGAAGHAVTGSYGLRDADGRIRTVNYIADAAGFRASISTNEPGVEPKSPADTLINGVAPIVAAPLVEAAPLVAAPAAPIVAAAPAFHHAPAFAAPIAAAPIAAPVAHAPIQGYSFQSNVHHAIPARAHAAPLLQPAFAHAAPIVAPVAAAPAPIRIAQPWGFTSSW